MLRLRPNGINKNNLVKIPCHAIVQPFRQNIRFYNVKTRSIRNKCDGFLDYVISNRIDLCTVTEIWLTQNDDAVRAAYQPEGYTFVDQERLAGRRGGGTAVLISIAMSIKKLTSGEKDSFEFSEWLVTNDNFALRLCIIYVMHCIRSTFII